MAYKLPQIDLKKIAQQKKEGLLKGSSTPTTNILSGSPVATPAQKPQTLLTLKQPLSDKAVSNLSKIQGTSNAAMGNPAIKQTQSSYVPLTKEQFQKARAAGFTPEKIIEMEQKRKEQSVPKKTVSEKIDKFGADLMATGISGAIRGTGNILGTATKGAGWLGGKIYGGLDKIVPGDQSGLGKGVQEMGTNLGNRIKAGAEETAKDFEALQGRVSSQGPINQDSAAAKIGGFIGETIPAMYSGGAAAKGIIGTSAKLLPKIARGGIEGYAFDVASGGEMPGVGTISGAVLPGVGAAVSKLGGELGLKGLLKFGAKKKVAKQIADEVGESASKIDIYKWMKDRGITKKFADEDAMAKRLYEHSKQAKNAVDDITKSLSEKGATIKADQNVLGGLAKVIEKKGGSQSAEEIVKLNRANALLSKANKTGNLTLQEANEAKRLIDDSLDLYTFQGDVRMKNVDNANLRAGIRKSIEDTAKKFGVNIRDYNKEISIARTLADGITDKQMSNELVDRLWDFGMKTASRGVIGNIIAPFGHETKTDYLLNGIAGFVIGGSVNKAVGNRRLVNFASNVMTSFSGAEKNIIKEYFKNKKMTPQAEKVIVKLADKIDETYKQLPPGEQRLLLSPPKSALPAPKGNALPMPKVPEGASYPKTDIISESNRGINFGKVKTTVPETSVIPKAQSTNSILEQVKKPQAEVSKVVKKSASKDIKNPPIISQITKKQTKVPETPKIDNEMKSLQESIPMGRNSVEVPESYKPKDGLPTGAEFENSVLPTATKTKGKIPNPEIKRPQIRGFDLSTRSSMLESLKEQGMFTDSFFVVKDKNLSNKLFEYAEKKAVKKGNPTSGTKVDIKALVERAENGADTKLTPKEYMKLGKDNGVYLRMDIGNGNQVAINATYADIFFKNFDDVTFRGSSELSPVVVLSKGEPVGVIMPIKDVYNLTDKLGDFSTAIPKQKPSLPMSQRTPVKYGKVDDLASEARKYKSAEENTGIVNGNSKNEVSIQTKDGNIIFNKTVKDSVYNGKKEYFQTLSGETPQGEKISIRFMTDSRGETLKILNFASEAKGKGYGTDLLNSVIKDAKSNGIKKIIADDINYHNASGYWKKQGFTIIENGNAELNLINK